MECADKGDTGHKERAIDVPSGKMPSVCLRKHWATGREAKEVVGCWIGFALEGLPCMCKPWQREDQDSGLERSWPFSWAGCMQGRSVVLVW